MCNALNHRPGCRCGWGGDGHLGRTLGGFATPRAPARPTLHARAFGSRTEPNAYCPVCGQQVFFYQSPTGGRVFFDELGPPWPKHPCTDNPRVAVRVIDRSTPLGRPTLRAAAAGWVRDGWLAVHVLSSVREQGRHVMRCVLDEAGGPRELRVFPDREVILKGVAVAAMKPWDADGRSVISFVDLGGTRVAAIVGVSRSSGAQLVLVREKLDSIVSAAESAFRVADSIYDIRLADYERQVSQWAQHLSEAEAEPYWSRLSSARSRLADHLESEKLAEWQAQDNLLEDLEALLEAPRWSSIENDFTAAVGDWHAQRPSWRHLIHRRAAAFEALELRGGKRSHDLRRAGLIGARIERKRRLIEELLDLQITEDLAVSDRQLASVASRWSRTGHFRELCEAHLTADFETAVARYRTMRRLELERVAAINAARELEECRAAKRAAIASVEALNAAGVDNAAADHEFHRVLRVWSSLCGGDDDHAESEINAAFERAVSAFRAIQDERLRRERRVEQVRVVQDAEVLAQAPLWEPTRFQALSQRWTATGPDFDPALRQRLEVAYFLARSPAFREAVKVRLDIIAGIAELVLDAAGSADPPALATLQLRWADAPWAGPEVGPALDERFARALAKVRAA